MTRDIHTKIMRSYRDDFESGTSDETEATTFEQLAEYANSLADDLFNLRENLDKFDMVPSGEARTATALERIANALEIANGLTAEASSMTSGRESYVIEWADELHCTGRGGDADQTGEES